MQFFQVNAQKYLGNPLRGFWNEREAGIKRPCKPRPDLVDERNRTTDRAPRGKRNKFTREPRDCGVRALAICANIPYDRALVLLAARGRKSGGCCSTQFIVDVLRFDLGYMVTRTTVAARTLVTLERELIRGVYLVAATTHLVALVNGRVWDGQRWTRMRLQHVFKVETSKSAA